MSVKSRSGNLSHRSHSSHHKVGSVSSRDEQLSKSIQSLDKRLSDCKGVMSVPCGTLLVIAACLFIHLEIVDIPTLYTKNACLGLYQVFYLQQYSRIFLCHFVHNNTWELVFQLTSLLWKGHQLEKCCGALYFILMILIFAPCCSLALFVMHKILADTLDPVFITHCFCGLGSINFALKVIKMYQTTDPGVQCMFGDYLCFRFKYISWAEIVFSHLISSTATIAANMAGVVVGLLYISGILQFVIDFLANLSTGNTKVFGWVTSLVSKTSNSKALGSLTSLASAAAKSVPILGGAEPHESSSERSAASN